MGMVNKVVPLDKLEDTVVDWCKIMQAKAIEEGDVKSFDQPVQNAMQWSKSKVRCF